MKINLINQFKNGDITFKRKFLFGALSIAVVTLFALFLTYYHFVLSRHITTDNAYVGAEMAQVTAQTLGTVKTVSFTDTDFVKEGDVLVVLDDKDAKLAFAKAQAEYDKAEADFEKTKVDSDRRSALLKSGSVSAEEVTTSGNSHKIAKAVLDVAKAALDQSQVDLDRTTIKSPIAGVIAKRQVQLGQRVQSGSPLMAVVPFYKLHVDANFKETQVQKIRSGQRVEMTTDIYGDSVVFHGKVVGVSGGTGAAFSVIPAQNATGNWIKVVQRLPVRISLDPEELKKYPLYVGLSVDVDVSISGE